MKQRLKNPPRIFTVGKNNEIKVSDLGKITLAPDEMVTFDRDGCFDYNLCRKSWGYYATPSINHRLKAEGFYTALARSQQGHQYLWLIENDKMDEL
ncbi:MAG: hypothetical protein AAF352_06940, partial [Pseudomonadota bacterium]